MKRTVFFSAACTALLLVFAGVEIAMIAHQYQDMFFPNTYIDATPIGNKSFASVSAYFAQLAALEANNTITLTTQTTQLASTSAQLNISRDYQQTISRVFQEQHQATIVQKLGFVFFADSHRKNYASNVIADESVLKAQLELLKARSDDAGIEPGATLKNIKKVKSIEVFPGKSGRIIDERLALQIIQTELQANIHTISVPENVIVSELSPDQVASAAARAQKLIGKQIIAKIDESQLVISDQDIISLLSFPSDVSAKKLHAYVANISEQLNRPAKDAVFDFDQKSLQVHAFSPGQRGITLKASETAQTIREAIVDLENTASTSAEVALAADISEPTTALEHTNSLGIQQKIGIGKSLYAHSIPGRIHNVELTSSRINNTIVPAGAEFSFNQVLGDVSAATGFAQAYVIRSGKTVLGDGGGVCQVSTTLFRALLNAGLPITKRHAHSYRVGYYEEDSPPGFDATVYGGDVDLRFVNDTGHAILIHSTYDHAKLSLTIDLYGTPDGRTTEIVDRKVWDVTPAPAPLYQIDPSLKPGQVKQIDFAAPGTKASFTNIVRDKTGRVLRNDEYFSNYQPWQAVYLTGG